MARGERFSERDESCYHTVTPKGSAESDSSEAERAHASTDGPKLMADSKSTQTPGLGQTHHCFGFKYFSVLN